MYSRSRACRLGCEIESRWFFCDDELVAVAGLPGWYIEPTVAKGLGGLNQTKSGFTSGSIVKTNSLSMPLPLTF